MSRRRRQRLAALTPLPQPAEPTREDIRAHLEGLEKRELVDLIMNRALLDAGLAQELRVRAVADGHGGTFDVDAMKREIDRATDSHGYVDWREVGIYANGVEDIVDALERLAAADDERAAEIVELSEYALLRLDEAMGHVQDDGDLEDAIKRLHAMHLAACIRLKPDPVTLAHRLFERELTSGFGFFHRAEETYKHVLGAAGLAEYRRLAEAEWARVPALGPGWREQQGASNRHRITPIIERLARAEGSAEAVVAVLVKDLSEPHCYLRIAEEYVRHGEIENARRWAEKGMKAFARTPDRRLSVFLEGLSGSPRPP